MLVSICRACETFPIRTGTEFHREALTVQETECIHVHRWLLGIMTTDYAELYLGLSSVLSADVHFVSDQNGESDKTQRY